VAWRINPIVSCTIPYCIDAAALLSSRSIAVQSSRTSNTSRAIEYARATVAASAPVSC
jgi:hypothetical protein